MYMENGDSMGPSGLQLVIYTCVYIYIHPLTAMEHQHV